MKEQKRVPKLRFEEFSGEWNLMQLNNYIDLLSGYAFKGEDISEDTSGTPLLRGINITEGRIRHSKEIDRYFVGETSNIEKYFVQVNDLVLGMDGSKVGKNVALVNKEDEGALLIQRVARIRAKSNADIRFIFMNIFSNKFHRYVDVVNTSSGIPHISSKQIKEFTIGFPSLPEQQKIASFLSAVDKKIAQLQQKKRLLEDYKKGVMQQIFSQKLRFTREDGSAYPDWEEKRLGEVLKIGSGKDYKHLKEGLIPVYGTGGLMTFVNDYLFEGESVGIGRKGTIDKPVFLEGKFWTVDTLFYSHSFNKVLPKFIYYFFLLVNWKKYNEASGVPSLSKGTIEKINISVPCIEEQTQIAEFLSAIDKKIAVVQTQIEKTQTFKKGLLQQMFV